MAFDLNNIFGIKKAIKYLLGKTSDLQTSVTAAQPNFTEYTAFIEQTGTNPPTEVNVQGSPGAAMVDTLGGTWSYDSTGNYFYTAVGAFVDMSKVFAVAFDPNATQGADVRYSFEKINDDILALSIVVSSQYSTPSILVKTDGVINSLAVTIKVYQ